MEDLGSRPRGERACMPLPTGPKQGLGRGPTQPRAPPYSLGPPGNVHKHGTGLGKDAQPFPPRRTQAGGLASMHIWRLHSNTSAAARL